MALPPTGDEDEFLTGNCDLDASKDTDSAYEGIFDSDLRDTICPRRDDDYWRFTTTGTNKIVTAEATYLKLSGMRLAIEWQGPLGRCVNTPLDGCSALTECDTTNSAELCDIDRGGCKPSANSVCTAAQGCGANTACIEAPERLAKLVEPDGVGGTLHRVFSNFPASTQGEYFLRILDQALIVGDSTVQYTLKVIEKDDPDTNEPNNYENLSTPLAPGTPMKTYLAYTDDEDWYSITHSVPNIPIVTVELSWPADADINPVWQLRSPDGAPISFVRDSGDVETVGQGSGAVRTLRSRIIGPVGSSFIVVVKHEDVAKTIFPFDEDSPYTLTVSVNADPDEPPTRNDIPLNAEVVTIAEGVATPATTDAIISEDDIDWFKVQAENVGQNSLLYAAVQGPSLATAEYILEMTVYQGCDPSGTCDYCFGAVGSETCIQQMYTLPYAFVDIEDGPPGFGSYQYGGPVPNSLRTQLPIYVGQEDSMYVSVRHIPSTIQPVEGSSLTQKYTLTLLQREEPDAVDASVNYDNNFLSYPIRPGRNGPRRDDFRRAGKERTVGSGDYTSNGGSAGPAIAYPVAGQVLSASTCSDVNIEAIDGLGAALETGVVTITASTGDFVENCAAQVSAGLTTSIILGTPPNTVAYLAPAAGPLTFTLDVDSAQAVMSTLPVGAPANGTIVYSDGNSGAAPRGMATTATLAVTVGLQAPPVQTQLLNLSVSDGAGIVCADVLPDSDGNPTDNCNFPVPATAFTGTPCTRTPQAACQMAVTAGSPGANISISKASAGAFTLSTSTLAAAFDEKFHAVAYTGAQLNTTTSIEGYISYAGDNDFFRIPLSGFPVGGGFTIHVSMPASDVDIRANVYRGDAGAGTGVRGDDYCNNTSSGYCAQPAFNNSAGISAGSGVFTGDASPACTYSDSNEGELLIWVNDKLFNDWDLGQRYQIDVEFVQGCSPLCNGFVCQ